MVFCLPSSPGLQAVLTSLVFPPKLWLHTAFASKEDWDVCNNLQQKQLTGEHVDYSGYGVLPMALDRQDTVMAVHVADAGDDATEDTIILNNLHNRHAYS